MRPNSVCGLHVLACIPTMSDHAPDETMDALLRNLLPDMDQGISRILDSLWRLRSAWIQVRTSAPSSVMHHKEPRAHCINISSEDLLPVPIECQDTFG